MTDTVQLASQPLSRGTAGLVPEALSAQLFHAAQARHLKAGERLFAIGDPGDGCFLLEQGLLKATAESPLGEERIIAILGPGAIVGELSMIDGLPRSASVVAMRDCVLRFVSREAFQRRANTKSETHQVLQAILAARLRQVDEDLVATTFLTVKARVARALLKLAEYIGQPSSEGHIVFQDRITLADLAAMAGVARENASRVLSDWRRRKFVTGSPCRICLNNIAAIEREMDLTDRGHARPRAGIARHVGAKLSEDEARASRRACWEI
jgi:CRP/FNR family transcriptional regulator, cyclic AMP receptor protein